MYIVYKVPLPLSFAPTATNFSVCNSKTAGDAHHRSSYAGSSGCIKEDRGPAGSFLSSAARQAEARANAISYCTLLHLHFYQAFCIVQLSDTRYTHSGTVSAPSVPQEDWRSESPKGFGRTALKTCIGNRLLPPHLQQHIFHSQSPKVANFRPEENRTIAFHYWLASAYISKGFLKGGFNSSPHLFCILHSYYYMLLS